MLTDEDKKEFMADDAATFIGEFCLRWGRINVRQYKEKYGTVRVYCNLGWRCLLNITHPSYIHYGPYPKWLMTFDIYHGNNLLRYTGIARLSFYYHKFIYRLAYKKAIQKFPEIKNEILNYADWDEFLQDL